MVHTMRTTVTLDPDAGVANAHPTGRCHRFVRHACERMRVMVHAELRGCDGSDDHPDNAETPVVSVALSSRGDSDR